MNKLKRVLLVDDDEVATFLNTRLLGKLGCAESILTAEDGQEAFEMLLKDCSTDKVTECWLDLVFLDINMPIMDGFDFLQACRETAFKCAPKIVLLSSSTHAGDMEKARLYGISEVLQKPLTEESIRGVLGRNFGCCGSGGKSCD